MWKSSKNIFVSIVCTFYLSGCSYNYSQTGSKYDNKKVIVAVVLPMTGKNASVSESLLNSINLSYYETGNDSIVFKVYDLPTESKNVYSVAKDIIADGAKLILGPVFSDNTKKLLAITDKYSIPVISFSNDITLLQSSDNLFLASSPIVNDMEMIINFSSQRGSNSSKRYAILAPDSKYGDLLVLSATRAIESRKLSLVKVIRYPDKQVKLSDYIVKLINQDELDRIKDLKLAIADEPTDQASKKKLLKQIPKPELDFDTLIIGAYGDKLPLVVSHFPLLDIDYSNLVILGNSNWNVKDIAITDTLDGAFYTSLRSLEDTKFYKTYKHLYGRIPNVIDVAAYDVVKMLVSLVSYDNDGNFVLNVTPQAIASNKIFSGAYGDFSIRRDGIFVRSMFVNQITKSDVVQLPVDSSLSYINYPNYRDR